MSTYVVTVQGTPYTVSLRSRKGTSLTFEVDGETYSVDLHALSRPSSAGPRASSSPPSPQPTVPASAPQSANALEVRAPLPGIVSDIKAAVGDTIESGQTVVVIEAMKMENAIRSHRSGTVSEIHVQKGQEVPNGAVLISFRE